MPAFFKYTLGNTYMYVFDMATDQGCILEQAGSDIKIEFDRYNDCMTLIVKV